MPTQSRGFFTCDFCGLACDTFEEATEHEYQCPKRPPQSLRPSPPGGQVPPPAPHHQQAYPPGGQHYGGSMAPLSTPQVEGYAPHHGALPHYPPSGGPPPSPHKLRSIALMGPSVRETGVALEDCVACQSIELFEATPELAADYDASRSGGTPVVVRQVGLRCIHCAKSPMPTANYSIVFPSSLGAMASSVRMIAESHLVSCRMTPPEIREACDRASKRRQQDAGEGRGAADEDERNRMALLDYCVGFCQHMGIVNKQPHKTGVSFADADIHGGGPAAETPAPHRAPGVPYSGDRMGPPPSYDRRLGYPTPGPPRQGMTPMMGGGMAPGESIAPTPLQRRRDRPGEPAVYSAERDGGPPSAGFPTPYSQGPPGGEGGYPHEMQTPAQPNFEGKEGAYPTPHSAPPSAHPPETSPGYNQYDLPSNFPFYQEADRSWHCKFCSHLHPSYRDPQAIWSTASGGPPPGNFIDSHLMLCRSYHQSMPSPPMYQGPPPPYGAPPPFGAAYPPPPGWEGTSPTHVAGMPPQHLHYPGPPHPGEPPFPYPPPHMDPGRPYPGPEDPAYADQRARLGPHPGMPPHGGPPPPLTGLGGRPPVQRKENMADAVRHSINHLVAREKEYFARDPAAAKADRLVLEEDKLLLTDYFFFLMKQLRLCRFSESDRKTRGGKREKIKLGYGGLQCIHCADVPNSRKFFWSNVDRLANSFAEIPGHILKCRRCPQQTKDSLLQLKQFHPEQMARLPRGSQKVFFRRMWRRLHDEDSKAGAAAEAALADKANNENVAPATTTTTTKSENSETPLKEGTETKQEKTKSPEAVKSEENPVVMKRSTTEAAKALADATKTPSAESPTNRVSLAVPDDKEWLSDMDCFIRKQLEVFCANEADVATAQSDRKYPVHVGQVGIRCIHCSGKDGQGAKGTAVAFPFAISGIYESVREFQRLHLDSCENLPTSTKEKLAAFKGSSSLSSVLRKYYVLAAKALGLQDTREGIRAGGEAVPLGSQAAFSFAEGKDSHLFKEMRGIASPYPGEPSASDPAAPTATSPATPSSEKAGVKAEEKADPATEEEGKKRQDSPVEPEEPPVKKVKAEEAGTEPSKNGESNGSSVPDEARESTDATPVASTDREAD